MKNKWNPVSKEPPYDVLVEIKSNLYKTTIGKRYHIPETDINGWFIFVSDLALKYSEPFGRITHWRLIPEH